RRRRLPRGRFHLLAETERTHVGPHLLDVIQAFLFRPALAGGRPAGRSLLARRPDRVLLFVIHDDLVGHAVVVFPRHVSVPLLSKIDDITRAVLTACVAASMSSWRPSTQCTSRPPCASACHPSEGSGEMRSAPSVARSNVSLPGYGRGSGRM